MNSNKDMLRLRVAASKLYKFFPNIYIQLANSDYYDLIISDRTEGFVFGAKVGSTKMFRTKEYEEYFQRLSSASFDLIKYPVIVLSVNETSEEVSVGLLTSIRGLRPVFYRNPKMVAINEENASILFDNIKSLDKVIRALNNNNWGIIKKIEIIKERHDGLMSTASVIYLRSFGEEYKMKEPLISNEREKFRRLAFGIPENEYPSDILDDIIKQGITSIFRDSVITQRSSLLLFNTDLDNLRSELGDYDVPKEIWLQIEPDLDEAIMNLGFFTAVRLKFSLYPGNPLLNNLWRSESTVVTLDSTDWKSFYDTYKSGPKIITEIDQIVL